MRTNGTLSHALLLSQKLLGKENDTKIRECVLIRLENYDDRKMMNILLQKMRHFRCPGRFKSQEGGEGGGGDAIGCQRNGAENINADSFLPLFSLTQLKDNPSCSAVILTRKDHFTTL